MICKEMDQKIQDLTVKIDTINEMREVSDNIHLEKALEDYTNERESLLREKERVESIKEYRVDVDGIQEMDEENKYEQSFGYRFFDKLEAFDTYTRLKISLIMDRFSKLSPKSEKQYVIVSEIQDGELVYSKKSIKGLNVSGFSMNKEGADKLVSLLNKESGLEDSNVEYTDFEDEVVTVFASLYYSKEDKLKEFEKIVRETKEKNIKKLFNAEDFLNDYLGEEGVIWDNIPKFLTDLIFNDNSHFKPKIDLYVKMTKGGGFGLSDIGDIIKIFGGRKK